jgi:hypothetical protein
VNDNRNVGVGTKGVVGSQTIFQQQYNNNNQKNIHQMQMSNWRRLIYLEHGVYRLMIRSGHRGTRRVCLILDTSLTTEKGANQCRKKEFLQAPSGQRFP